MQSSPVPYSRLRRREQDFRFLSARGDRRKEARARSPEGHWRQVEPPVPRIEPLPGGTTRGPPSTPGLWSLGRGCGQPGRNAAGGGLRWGRKGITRGFQQRKGGKGRDSKRTPSLRRGAGSHLQAPESSVPFLPEPFQSPGPIALLSPSRLLCAGVRHSDPPLPRGGNSSCRSATGSTGPLGNKR